MAKKTSDSQKFEPEHFLTEHIKVTHVKGLGGKPAVKLSVSFRCKSGSCSGAYLESVSLKSGTSAKG